MQRNNTSSTTICFRVHAAIWEHWKGLQTPACPRPSPLLGHPLCSCAAPKQPPRPRWWGCPGCFSPRMLLEMLEQKITAVAHGCEVCWHCHSCQHSTAVPDQTLFSSHLVGSSENKQSAKHRSTAHHQLARAVETFLVSVCTLHTSRNLLGSRQSFL